MSTVHMFKNTEKSIPCTNCGSEHTSVIREAPSAEDKKLKCLRCNFLFTEADSLGAQSAGSIPDGPPELDPQQEITQNWIKEGKKSPEDEVSTGRGPGNNLIGKTIPLPRTITHIIISKDRFGYDFCNKRTLKKTILSWEHAGKKYDVFELHPKKVSAKIDIQ